MFVFAGSVRTSTVEYGVVKHKSKTKDSLKMSMVKKIHRKLAEQNSAIIALYDMPYMTQPSCNFEKKKDFNFQ